MDTVMLGMGRDLTLHLQPTKTRCPAPDCRYAQTYEKFIGANGQICRSCGGQGYFLEPRQTVYTANIRWIDGDLATAEKGGKDTPAGRVIDADVRTKTVYASLADINNCVSAEIDGKPVKLKTSPRVTGFGGQLLYVVSYWEETNKKVN